MAPKLLRRLRWLRATRFCFVVVLLGLVGSARVALADGGAVPIVDARAPRVQIGVPTKTSIAVTGGSAPYAFEVVDGALPAGLSLRDDGTLSGTPTQSGPFRFTVRVTDSSALRASVLQTYVVFVQDRLDPTLDPNTIALLNQQAGTVRRFALAQIANFQTRMQALRSDSAGRCADNDRRPTLTAPTRSTQKSTSSSSTGLLEQPPQQESSFSMPLDNCRTLPDRSTTLWTAGALNIGSYRGQAGASGFRFDSQGITLGGDFGLQPNLAFGAGVGFARDESQAVPVGGTSSGAYGSAFAGYLSYRPFERFYLDAVFGVGDVAMDSTRVASNGGEAYGTRRGQQRFVSFSAGHRFGGGDWQVVPYTRVDHVRATLRQLNESGSGTDALSLSEEKVPSLKVVAGATAATSFSTSIGTIAPRGSVEYRRELERSDAASLRFADDVNGPSYSVVPNGTERDSTTLGFGANLFLASRWNVGLGCTINRSSASSSSRIDAMLSKVF
jgi:hypothetical protein